MALAALLFGATPFKKIGDIAVDAFVEESINSSASATDYPVEEGANISDHITQAPLQISVTGVINPGEIGNLRKPYNIRKELEALKVKGEPVTIVTGLEVYKDMAIESYNVQRSAANGLSLEFTMSLKKIRIVKSQTTTIPKSKLGGSDSDQKQSQGKADAGKSNSTNAAAKEFQNGVDTATGLLGK